MERRGTGNTLEKKAMGVGVEGQYFATSPDVKYIQSESNLPVYLGGKQLRYHEYQVGIGGSYQIPFESVTTPWFLMWV